VIYSLDANVFVDALRQPHELDRLSEFLRWGLSRTVLSSVVAAELSAGVRTDGARKILDERILAPFSRRNRIVAPSEGAWHRVGGLMAMTNATRVSASRQNDLLLAAQARESGWTVVTRDRDFDALRRLIGGLRVAEPFPERP
jgi:predicted nucleic acid-binding protein